MKNTLKQFAGFTLVLLSLSLSGFVFAQTQGAPAPVVTAPAAVASAPSIVAVDPTTEAAVIAADITAATAAHQAEQAPYKALQAGQALTVAAGTQTALHAASIAADNKTRADLYSSAAKHSVDTNQLQYSPTSAAWVKAPHGGPQNRNGMPLTQ